MYLLGHELALVHDSVGRERADVGVLVIVALAVPLVLDQLAQHVELHQSNDSISLGSFHIFEFTWHTRRGRSS
jgi:hypothetical protein